MLKIWRSDYFESEIKPLINGNDIVIHKIDFKDEFTMQTIRARTEEGYYKEFKTAIEDLSKVIRFIDNVTLIYIQKAKNVYTNTYHVQFASDKDMSKSLKMMKLWIETVYTTLVRYASKLSISCVKFNSSDNDVFSTFQGLKYSNGTINEELIKPFLELVYEVICSKDVTLYYYVLNWISNIIQHPGMKNETALVIKGLQRIGKNTFTDVVSELLSGYSVANVTDLVFSQGRLIHT